MNVVKNVIIALVFGATVSACGPSVKTSVEDAIVFGGDDISEAELPGEAQDALETPFVDGLGKSMIKVSWTEIAVDSEFTYGLYICKSNVSCDGTVPFMAVVLDGSEYVAYTFNPSEKVTDQNVFSYTIGLDDRKNFTAQREMALQAGEYIAVRRI